MSIVYCSQWVGLANRLRALASYLAMSRVLEKPFYLCWVPDVYCDAEFTDLFLPSPEINLISLTRKNQMKSEPNTSIYTAHDWFDEIWRKYLRDTVDINEFGKLANTCLQQLSPITHISEKANAFSLKHSIQDATGIHIRLTDNVKSYEIWAKDSLTFQLEYVSRFEGFQRFVSDSLKQEKSTKIYLSTDNIKVERKFKRLFPDIVMVYPKQFNPDAKLTFSWKEFQFRSQLQRTSSIEDALVEMLLLSKCRCVVGTYFSSFSKLSGCLGNPSSYFEVRGDQYTKSDYFERLKGNVPF